MRAKEEYVAVLISAETFVRKQINIMDRYCNVFELTIRPFKRIMVAFVEYATTRTDLIRHKAEGFEQIVRCDSIVLRYSTLSKKNNIHLSPAYNGR